MITGKRKDASNMFDLLVHNHIPNIYIFFVLNFISLIMFGK